MTRNFANFSCRATRCDTGRSGWMILLGIFFHIVGGLILFIFSLLDSQRGTNAYGPSLKYPD